MSDWCWFSNAFHNFHEICGHETKSHRVDLSAETKSTFFDGNLRRLGDDKERQWQRHYAELYQQCLNPSSITDRREIESRCGVKKSGGGWKGGLKMKSVVMTIGWIMFRSFTFKYFGRGWCCVAKRKMVCEIGFLFLLLWIYHLFRFNLKKHFSFHSLLELPSRCWIILQAENRACFLFLSRLTVNQEN